MYTVIALIVLLSAVWIGLNFANYLVAPIRRLIGAATGRRHRQSLCAGARSAGRRAISAHLGETFNKMTQELRTQRDDIVRARDLIDSRRRFTEAVLAGASAGVIGVDADGRISILNRSAEQLIGCTETETLGRLLHRESCRNSSEICRRATTGAPAAGAGPGHDQPQRPRAQSSVRVTSEQSAPPNTSMAMSSRSTTSPISSPRSARRPGPTWRGASPTRSRTR